MRVETHNALRDPRSFEATQVVAYDRFGYPISVTLEHDDGHYSHHRVGDPDFAKTLDLLGLGPAPRAVPYRTTGGGVSVPRN